MSIIIALLCVAAVAIGYLLLRRIPITERRKATCPECGVPLDSRDQAWFIERSVQILRRHDTGRWPAATSVREVEGWKALACGHRVELVVDNGPTGLSVYMEAVGDSTPALSSE